MPTIDSTISLNDPRVGQQRRIGVTLIGTDTDGQPVYGFAAPSMERLDATNDSIAVAKWGSTTQQLDEEFTILASAARTATNSVDLVKPKMAKGLVIFVGVTAGAGASDTLTITLIARDATTTSITKTIGSLTAIAANGTFIYQFYPAASIAGSYSQSVPIAIPQNVRANFAHATGVALVYAAGGCWLS